ncbi:ATP-binding protein [Bhargavaea cecembensis]|uniref:ATP-binding protein n=1 Tax=Bhargavaea cecembensis TaxID=394098 RepID=UPI00058DD297|nr:ATP-binding protein [Bhargavaea cecembensis]
MKKYKSSLAIVVFVVFLIALRLAWMNFLGTLEYEEQPRAERGVIDLRGWTFNDRQTLRLSGEWGFYPSALPETGGGLPDTSETFTDVPGNWKAFFAKEDSYYYGTYRLKVLLDPDMKTFMGLRIHELPRASSVSVNGKKYGGAGTVAASEKEYKGQNRPYEVYFPADQEEMELVISVSGDVGKGGMITPIHFGSAEAIKNRTMLSYGLQLLLCLILLLHSVYGIILFLMRVKPRKGLLYFSLLLLCAIVSVLTSDDKLLYRWFPVGEEWSLKLTFLSYIGVGAFLLLVVKQIFPVEDQKRLTGAVIVYCIGYALFVMLAPPRDVIATARVLLLAVLVLPVFASIVRIRKTPLRMDEGIYLLLGCISIGVNIAWVTVMRNSTGADRMHYPFDLIIALLCFAAFWFKRFSRVATDAVRFSEKLQLENRRKDEFLVNTSHELRNPLHGISAVVQTMLDDSRRPVHEVHRKQLSLLIGVSRRMSRLVEDLMDISQLKDQTIELEIDRIDMRAAATGVLDMTGFIMRGKPVRLRMEIPEGFPAVLADENRLAQILFNLIHNAVKYTDEGWVAVRATAERGMASIQIEDTGIGMKPEELQSIFDPYEQGEAVKVRNSGGFGLGLSITRQLVEMHGGTITAQSAPGEGSVFTFTLPLPDGAEEKQSPTEPDRPEQSSPVEEWMPPRPDGPLEQAPTGSPTANAKILVVDDDPVNVDILISILEGEAYSAIGETNPLNVLKRLGEEAFDLVISDVMMPQMSGYELTRMIRDRYSIAELPVLLLTARVRTEDAVAGFRAGANDYVLKPADPLELKARVGALMALKTSIEDRMRMEAAWLQSQIQPHFIFNTLNSISAFGMLDPDRMQELLEEFSNYLRLSFDFHNAEPLVPVEQELSLVRSYLYIEKARFQDRLAVEWDIDERPDILVPPLSIQPLVENAVGHGILKVPQGGKIIIRIRDCDSFTEVSVADNGVGMPPEKVASLFSRNRSPGRTSVGLRNIDARLKQLYGKGLVVESRPGSGTTIRFYIPKKAVE